MAIIKHSVSQLDPLTAEQPPEWARPGEPKAAIAGESADDNEKNEEGASSGHEETPLVEERAKV